MRLIIALFLGIFVRTAYADFQSKALAAAQTVWPEAEADFGAYQIGADLKREIAGKTGKGFYRQKVYTMRLTGNGKLLGYALVDTTWCREDTATLLAVFDPDFRITNVAILEIVPDFGGKLNRPEWLSRFRGKNAESAFRVGQDIDAVSGASISARSVAACVRRLAMIAPAVFRK